ncbi:cystatin family protein [Robertkochia sediminum]|uniref:cystatin family protein n=1 Tax=Robertkochia sediminum TaxID=2785326 RepID=UPI00193323A5|nr:cystatin domain-containing protein [Robertkochia sediminum]MBL7472918.1 hypothetical protein [Robertkochia sediminum]
MRLEGLKERDVLFFITMLLLLVSCKQDWESAPGKSTAGGWQEAPIDPEIEEAVAFVLDEMDTPLKLVRIISAKKQVVKGMNYDLNFEMENNEVWNARVYRDLSGEFSLTKRPELKE